LRAAHPAIWDPRNLGKGILLHALTEDQESSSIRALIDWLDYNGYTAITKPNKEFVDVAGRGKLKGDMSVELAVRAMELAQYIDQLVLFSGDGAFRALVPALQRRGIGVSVVSMTPCQPPPVPDELRRQAADHWCWGTTGTVLLERGEPAHVRRMYHVALACASGSGFFQCGGDSGRRRGHAWQRRRRPQWL
jgi:hypothetical protein